MLFDRVPLGFSARHLSFFVTFVVQSTFPTQPVHFNLDGIKPVDFAVVNNMDYGLWTLDRVAGRHDAVSLNPPVGYEKKLAEEKSADKAEGKVKGLGKSLASWIYPKLVLIILSFSASISVPEA